MSSSSFRGMIWPYCIFLLAGAAPTELHAQNPSAIVDAKAKCRVESDLQLDETISRLLLVQYPDANLVDEIYRLRKAHCLATGLAPELLEEIAKRLAILQPVHTAVLEEALRCRRDGDLTDYDGPTVTRQLEALKVCIKTFSESNPGFLGLRADLYSHLSSLEKIAGEDEASEASDKEWSRLSALHEALKKQDLILSAVALKDYERGRDIYNRFFQREIVPGAEAFERGDEATEEEAKKQFFQSVQSMSADVTAIFSLQPAAWIWALPILESYGSLLRTAGISDVAGAQKFLLENVELWRNALMKFDASNLRHAAAIAHLELAIGYNQIYNTNSAIYHAERSLAGFNRFSDRSRLVQAVTLLAGYLAEVARRGEAASVLYGWISTYADEKTLFRNRVDPSRVPDVVKQLAAMEAKVYSSLAAVLESEERFGEAEGFRRLAFGSAAVGCGGTSDRAPLGSCIAAAYDLAINLAEQGRVSEAKGLVAERPTVASDAIGGTLDRGSRAEKEAVLALLLDDPDQLARSIREAEGERGMISLLPAADVRRNKALLMAARGENAKAADLLTELISEAGELGSSTPWVSGLRAELARVRLRQGDSASAIVAARQSLGFGFEE